MTVSKKQRARDRTIARNAKKSNANDEKLIEARIAEMFDDPNSPQAWNTRLKMQGFGVADDLKRTKYFCTECGWRMFRGIKIYHCSNWTRCKRRVLGDEVKAGRGKAMEARKKALAEINNP